MKPKRVSLDQRQHSRAGMFSALVTLAPRHMEEIEWIERTSSDHPWDRKRIDSEMEENACLGIVSETNGVVTGHCLFELLQKRMLIHKLTVDCTVARHGIGTLIVDWLKSHALMTGRHRVTVACSEHSVRSHLFFRAQEFQAISEIKDLWPNENAILFQHVTQADK